LKNREHPFATSLAALVVAAGCASAPTSSRVAQSLESTHPECRVEQNSKLVMVREDAGGEVVGMLVVSVDPNELEVIRLDGQINELLMEAVSRDPAGASGLFSGES